MRQVGDLVRVQIDYDPKAKSKKADYAVQAAALLGFINREVVRQKAEHPGQIRPRSEERR